MTRWYVEFEDGSSQILHGDRSLVAVTRMLTNGQMGSVRRVERCAGPIQESHVKSVVEALHNWLAYTAQDPPPDAAYPRRRQLVEQFIQSIDDAGGMT